METRLLAARTGTSIYRDTSGDTTADVVASPNDLESSSFLVHQKHCEELRLHTESWLLPLHICKQNGTLRAFVDGMKSEEEDGCSQHPQPPWGSLKAIFHTQLHFSPCVVGVIVERRVSAFRRDALCA